MLVWIGPTDAKIAADTKILDIDRLWISRRSRGRVYHYCWVRTSVSGHGSSRFPSQWSTSLQISPAQPFAQVSSSCCYRVFLPLRINLFLILGGNISPLLRLLFFFSFQRKWRAGCDVLRRRRRACHVRDGIHPSSRLGDASWINGVSVIKFVLHFQ